MATISETLETGIVRRDLLTLLGTAAAAGFAASPAVAQSQAPTSGTASARPQGKSTVTLDRLPMGVLLIGIDRVDMQNRIDIPTFSALGQAYYEFEHDQELRVAVLYGKGPDFSQGLDLPSWGAGLRAGPFQAPPNFLDPLGTTGPERSKPLVVAVQGHVTRIAHELFLAADAAGCGAGRGLQSGRSDRRVVSGRRRHRSLRSRRRMGKCDALHAHRRGLGCR